MMSQVQPSPRSWHQPHEIPARSLLRRVPWRRLVVLALRIVAILIVSYLVVANVLLKTRLLRNAVSSSSASFAVSGNTADLRLDYDSAYSIIPGRVHLEGLSIRGRERDVEWLLTLDRADVSISLVDLLHKSLHATRLRSSGLTLRARLRLDREDATPEVIAALPPIAGFSDPPLLDDGPEPLPLTDAEYNLWSIHLEDVDVDHVREVWIHTVRSQGDSRVRGRLVFHPQRWLEVGPATVSSNGVEVFHGGQTLATGLRGSSEATVHPVDIRQAKGLAILDHVSYDGQLRGRANIAGVLRWLALWSDVRFTRWEGPIDSRLVVDHGKLAAGTRIRSEAPDSVVEAAGLAFEAPILGELGVDADLASLDARISGLRISQHGVERARVASIAASVTSPRVQLARLFDEARFTLDVGGAATNNVGAWKHFLPSTSPFVIRSGMVSADAHADGSLTERRGRVGLRLLARRLSVERGSDRFTADVTSDVRLHNVSLPGPLVVGTATVSVDDVAARLARARLAGKLASHVELRRGADRVFDFSGSSVVVRGVSARSARSGAAILVVPSLTAVAPRIALAPSGVSGRVSIDLPRAELVDLRRLRELLPLPAGLRIQRGWGRARLHAEVELGSGSMRGDGEVVARGVRARVGSTEVFGDLGGTVRARRGGGARGWTDLSGSTLAIDNAGTGRSVAPEDAWWGKATLRQATLRTSGGVRFGTKAHFTAKDASPATALVSQNTGVPAWAANIFRMPNLVADAQVRVAPSSLEVRSLVARGGSTSVRAEYAKRHGWQDGGVLLDLGWLSLGYDLADGETGLVLFGAEGWYGRKRATLRSAAAVAKRKTDAAEQLGRYAAMTPGLRDDAAKALAAQCALDVRSCDGASVGNLLRAVADAGERETLSGITHAPLVVAAAKAGTDGTTLDPVVIGAVAEALKIGGPSTLDNISRITRTAAASDSAAARGKLIAVSGRVALIRRDGPYSIGTLTTDAEPIHMVTPFATIGGRETVARFRGVFVQRYASAEQPPGQPPALVLVGAFDR
jgi:hypothetical protein